MQATGAPLIPSLPLRLWTVQDYHRMAEAGILDPREPVELVAGKIIQKMSPQKSPHATGITLTRLLLEERLGKRVLVRTQLPVSLNDYSEPEPDVAVVAGGPLCYAERHPMATEVYLIVEIADTTLKTDCGLKAKEYARSGIPDYWVLALKPRQLHLFRDPTADGYQTQIILDENAQLSPLHFPTASFQVHELLPPGLGEF